MEIHKATEIETQLTVSISSVAPSTDSSSGSSKMERSGGPWSTMSFGAGSGMGTMAAIETALGGAFGIASGDYKTEISTVQG